MTHWRWNYNKIVFFSSIQIYILLHADEANSFIITPTIPKSTPSPSIQHHGYHNHVPVHSAYSYYNTRIKSTSLHEHGADNENAYEYDDSEAESQFGTKEYWDEMYQGYGDFSSEEYSWYFGFGTVKPYWMEYMPNAFLPPKHRDNDDDNANANDTDDDNIVIDMPKILTPGVGNDPTLLDLYQFGYKDITAFDYSRDAIERQRELLEYDSSDNGGALEDIKLYVMDARDLKEHEIAYASENNDGDGDDDDEEGISSSSSVSSLSSVSWTDSFDIIFEKGALDAIYLSGPEQGNVQLAVKELTRVIKPGGYFMSISGVVPEEVRREMFHADKGWEWIRDGSDDLKAGVFVWKRIESKRND
jgi:hypothetical protein